MASGQPLVTSRTQWVALSKAASSAASYQKSGNELWATGAKGHGLRTIARWLLEVCA